MKTITRSLFGRSTAVTLAALACGCAAMSPTPPGGSGASAQTASTPTQQVQNCAVVNIGSPSRFACNGKVYTTFELAKIREQAANKAASGK